MIKAENHDTSKSVEHLIPNAVFSRKRKNNEGDFYACRKCNSRKSNIDYILGVLTKCQGDNSEFAAKSLIKAVTKEDGASKRFIRMVQTAKKHQNEVQMDIPIKGDELIEYIYFLGKGQFFKKYGVVYNPKHFVMKIAYVNKHVTKSFKEIYITNHNSNPFRDLENNKYSEVINNGECIIYSKNREYMFVFHDYTTIIVVILKKNKKNTLIAQSKVNELLKDFGAYT